MARPKAQKNFPKLHNATWPGVVGKGTPDNPVIELRQMLELTKNAEYEGVHFDGVDIFLDHPHYNIEGGHVAAEEMAALVSSYNLSIGTVVAPIWSGSAIGPEEKRKHFLDQVRLGCSIAKELRDLGVRPNGCVRIDSSTSVTEWMKDPEGNQKQLAETFDAACDIANEYDEVLAAEGEICWGGMHSWRRMLQLLEMVDRPQTLRFQADLAHTLLYLLGYNAPEDRLLPENFDWSDTETFDAAYIKMTDKLRPWTVDLHIAQNDATVFGSGSHDKTGRHCLPKDPNGKLDIVKYAGFWLKDEDGLLKMFNHICWDGCMFPNEVMLKQETWNDVLEMMVKVRQEYGWK